MKSSWKNTSAMPKNELTITTFTSLHCTLIADYHALDLIALFSFCSFFLLRFYIFLSTQHAQLCSFIHINLIIVTVPFFWSFISIRLNSSHLEFRLCLFLPSYFKVIFFLGLFSTQGEGIKVWYSSKKVFAFLFTTFRASLENKSSIFSLLHLNTSAFDSIVPFAFIFPHRKSSPTLFLDRSAKKSSVGYGERQELGNSSP